MGNGPSAIRSRIFGHQESCIAPQLKRDWIATAPAFARLLAWLDAGVESHGQTYLEIRRRLVGYFGRKRCLNPDDLADETLNRVARRLEEQGSITDTSPAHYCYIVAKYVLLEHLRDPRARLVLPGVGDGYGHTAAPPSSDATADERLLQCLDRCLGGLDREESQLILDYYRSEQRTRIESRRQLAAKLRLTTNALAIRACRIRDKLEACITACRTTRDGDVFRRVSSHPKEQP
jgi:hypothetical protein